MYHSNMTKEQAKNIFGRYYRNMCKVMGYAPSTVAEWPDELPEHRVNEVIGCAIRNGYNVPGEFLKCDKV